MPTRPRELWPDAAKGACILLVVLWHVQTKHVVHLPWVPAQAAWEWLNLLVQPVRVPLFFLLSGWLAARAVRRPWPVLLRGRVLSGYWAHAVWLVLGAAFFTLVPGLVTRTAHSPGELLLGLAVGYTNTWYLYALALYAVLARAALRLPVWLPLTAGLALNVFADTPPCPSLGNVPSLVGNLVFFLAGALRPDLVTALAGRGRRHLAACAGLYLPLAALAVATGTSRAVVVSTLLSLLGTATGVLVAVAAGRRASAGARAAAWLGRRTLAVYVLHLPLLALLHAAVPREAAPGPWAAVYPALAVAACTGGALLAHALLVRAGLGVLFAPPARLAPVPVASRS